MWKVLEERDGGDKLLRQYIDGDRIDEHLQLTKYGPDGSGGTQIDETYYYHHNAQSSVGGLTDSAGDVVEYYEYSYLGEPVIWDMSTGTAAPATYSAAGNEYMFQGRRFDTETGFYLFRNRYYDHRIGEYVSIDPSGIWSHDQGNGYSSLSGDPWNHTDPLGLDVVSIGGAYDSKWKNMEGATKDLIREARNRGEMAEHFQFRQRRKIVGFVVKGRLKNLFGNLYRALQGRQSNSCGVNSHSVSMFR